MRNVWRVLHPRRWQPTVRKNWPHVSRFDFGFLAFLIYSSESEREGTIAEYKQRGKKSEHIYSRATFNSIAIYDLIGFL